MLLWAVADLEYVFGGMRFCITCPIAGWSSKRLALSMHRSNPIVWQRSDRVEGLDPMFTSVVSQHIQGSYLSPVFLLDLHLQFE